MSRTLPGDTSSPDLQSHQGDEFTRGEWCAAIGQEGAWGVGYCDSDLLGAVVSSSYYEIRVAGVLPPEALLDFDRLRASVEPVETVLHGPLRDQAALHGLLARLETFGVQILEVRRLQDRNPPDGTDHPDSSGQ
jgi:hypothetical protein